MLAVGVDPQTERIAILVRIPIAGRDAGGQTAVRAEGDDLRPVLTRDRRRPIRGAVVDDENVGARKLASQLLEHGRKILLLVPRRDEDERGAARGHASSVRHGAPAESLASGQ